MRILLSVLMTIILVLYVIKQEWVTSIWILNSLLWMNQYYNEKEN